MKRLIDYHLLEWKNRNNHKPLLVRGARQVGKTHAIRELGKTFENFVEINFEKNETARTFFQGDFEPVHIIQKLTELTKKDIIPGKTLLFFDEIQSEPRAIIALRYFYENMQPLHVIAAGSLLEFAIDLVGMPVGRVSTLYMYPLSFLEFLVACGDARWAQAIVKSDIQNPSISTVLHAKLLERVGQYLAIGGMPAAVNEWLEKRTSRAAKIVHADLLASYQQDFGKYARKHQIKYLDLLFAKVSEQLSNKFMFSRVGEYKKRELEQPLELIIKAGLLYKIIQSPGQGIPLGAFASLDDFKLIFFDAGLCQALLSLDIAPWFIEPLATFINKGALVEAFVGQELMAYADPISKSPLFYWRRQSPNSQSEVDYLVQIKENVIPVKVKTGRSKRIQSMQLFFESHPHSPYGLRFSADFYQTHKNVYSYPLYAVVKPLLDASEELQQAVKNLVAD